MLVDRSALETLLAAFGIGATDVDLDALEAVEERERANVREIRRLDLGWDGPEPASASRWLEAAAPRDDPE